MKKSALDSHANIKNAVMSSCVSLLVKAMRRLLRASVVSTSLLSGSQMYNDYKDLVRMPCGLSDKL